MAAVRLQRDQNLSGHCLRCGGDVVIRECPENGFLGLPVAHVLVLDRPEELRGVHRGREAQPLERPLVLGELLLHLRKLRAVLLRPLGSAGCLREPAGDRLVGGHPLEEVDLEGEVVHRLPHRRVQLGDLRPALDVLEVLLANYHPVLEHALQLVSWDAGGELLERHRQGRREVAVRVVLAAVSQNAVRAANDRRVSAVRLLAAGDWVLPDGVTLAADVHRAALEGDRQRVAVQLLQQSAA
mmetsp:Transcript_42182/g.111503  ORF Transcript_42182/g.111503 Transcript_42182/m.111503 type:complete len:241 (+) Transcript_42182:157-879(+)